MHIEKAGRWTSWPTPVSGASVNPLSGNATASKTWLTRILLSILLESKGYETNVKSAGKFKSDEAQSIIYEKMPALTNTVEQTMIKNDVDALVYPTMSCVASVRHDAKDNTYKCDSDDPYAASYLASSAHLPEISVPARS